MTTQELQSIVVCFLFDGTEKYLRMTLNAVNSFISTTPHIRAGLLFPHNYDESIVISQLSDPSRAVVRRYETHFQNWNPTQHKLDIIKFSDEFNTIFWLDSDAIVYQDLTDLLWKFHISPCKVAFMKDHVCYNPQFLNVWLDWRQVSDPFIPQASFMGFKKEIMPPFFAAWKECWRKWIEPVPFLNYPNPVPSFPGSAFCTEQYALGMVLESDLVTNADVYELRRITFPLKGVTAPGTSNNNNATLGSNEFSMSEKFLSENELALLEEKFRGQLSFSSWGSFSGQSSWGESSFSGPEFSFSFSSWGVYPEFSFSYSSWGESFESSSFSGSFDFRRTSGFSFGSSGNSFSAHGGIWAPVDNIEGTIVHFYSTFYDQSQSWWQKNNSEVIPQINQYWDQRNQRPVYAVVPPSNPPTYFAPSTTTTTTAPTYYIPSTTYTQQQQQQQQHQRVSPPPKHYHRRDEPGL